MTETGDHDRVFYITVPKGPHWGELRPMERMVYLVLCDWAEEDHAVCLTEQRVAEEAGVSTREVRKCTRVLKDKGLIVPDGRLKLGRGPGAVRYRLPELATLRQQFATWRDKRIQEPNAGIHPEGPSNTGTNTGTNRGTNTGTDEAAHKDDSCTFSTASCSSGSASVAQSNLPGTGTPDAEATKTTDGPRDAPRQEEDQRNGEDLMSEDQVPEVATVRRCFNNHVPTKLRSRNFLETYAPYLTGELLGKLEQQLTTGNIRDPVRYLLTMLREAKVHDDSQKDATNWSHAAMDFMRGFYGTLKQEWNMPGLSDPEGRIEAMARTIHKHRNGQSNVGDVQQILLAAAQKAKGGGGPKAHLHRMQQEVDRMIEANECPAPGTKAPDVGAKFRVPPLPPGKRLTLQDVMKPIVESGRMPTAQEQWDAEDFVKQYNASRGL